MNFISNNLKFLRHFSGLSQQQFANLFNLNRGNIASYENGSAEPNIENLIKIAEYFHIDLVTLVRHNLHKIEGIERKIENEELVIKEIEQRKQQKTSGLPSGFLVLKQISSDNDEANSKALMEISQLFSEKYQMLNQIIDNFKNLQSIEQQILEKSISLQEVTNGTEIQ